MIHGTEAWVAIIALSLANGAVSMTIAKSRALEGVRDAIESRSSWFGEMAGCPYCVSHWISLALTIIYQPVLVPGMFYAVDMVMSAFAMVALTAGVCCAIYKSISTIGGGDDDED
jgi:hypothetical protein